MTSLGRPGEAWGSLGKSGEAWGDLGRPGEACGEVGLVGRLFAHFGIAFNYFGSRLDPSSSVAILESIFACTFVSTFAGICESILASSDILDITAMQI